MYNDISPDEEETMRYHFATTGELDFKEWKFKRNLEPFEIREKIRNSKLFKDFIYQWNHGVYNNQKDVGPLMGSLKNLGRTRTDINRETWFEYYFTCVKNYNQILPLIEKMAKETSLDFKTALNYWAIHILDSAYVGFEGEIMGKNAITEWATVNNKDVTVEFATPEMDTRLGVDVIVTDNVTGKIILGVQIKRTAYFHSTRSTVVEAREGYNPKKYAQFKKETGADVWYLDVQKFEQTGVLNKTTWWRALK